MKSRGTYIILGLLLGGVGAHSFYIGQYSDGVRSLLFSLIAVALAFNHSGVAVFMATVCIAQTAAELIFNRKDAFGRPLAM